MQKSFALGVAVLSVGLFAFSFQFNTKPQLADLPLAPNTADATTTAASDADAASTSVANESVTAPAPQPAPKPKPAPAQQVAADDYPVELIIPAIHLDAPIVSVGVTPQNEMDVPSGSTNNVGWYKDGTVPGQVGSAVFDAHVFAEFKNLKDVPAHATIYVKMHSGTELHFVAQQAQVYTLSDVPLQQLYAQDDQPRLNLITCAGNLTPDHSTYDHRLIVYATLK